MKTVFITGASSGIGKESAKLFQKKGWNVIATMRNPDKEFELTKLENVKVIECDVMQTASISNAIKTGIKIFGKIDVLINNAGYYTIGPFEVATRDEIKRQIDTNLLGVIQVCHEIIPYFRKQNHGKIINISSIAGVISVPLQALYHATKWGVEGFSESLQYELSQFNIQIKIIQPGVVKTDFFGRSMTITKNDDIPEYNSYSEKIIYNLTTSGNNGSSPEEAAITIYKAATDNKKKLRYPTGKAKEFAYIRKILPVNIFRTLTKMTMEK